MDDGDLAYWYLTPPLVFFTATGFGGGPKVDTTNELCTQKVVKSIDLDELSSSTLVSSHESVTKKSYGNYIFFSKKCPCARNKFNKNAKR